MNEDSPDNGSTPSMESVFLNKIESLVLDNLNCENFSIERLSHEIGYSRSQIHRKLKKITGKSVTQFIREIRLREAYKLLEKRVGTVSEISFSVGFKSPEYFSRCFSSLYGRTPGEILNSDYSTEPLNKSRGLLSKVKRRSAFVVAGAIILIVAFSLFFSDGMVGASSTGTNKGLIFKGDPDDFHKIYKVGIGYFNMEEDSDSSFSWLSYGIGYGIILDLQQFSYILNYNNHLEYMQEKIDNAKRFKFPYYITGSYRYINGFFDVSTQLIDSKTNNIAETRHYRSTDIFDIIDSISFDIRIDIGVPNQLITENADLPFGEHTTNNIDAYKYLIYDTYVGVFWRGNFVNLAKALELDPTFARASGEYAEYSFRYSKIKSLRSAAEYSSITIENIARLPGPIQLEYRALNYAITGDAENELNQLEKAYNLYPANTRIIDKLIAAYNSRLLFNSALELYRVKGRLIADDFYYQLALAQEYLLIGQYRKGLKYIGRMMKRYPEHPPGTFVMKGQLHLCLGEIEKAQEEFRNARLANNDFEPWQFMLDHVEYLKDKGNNKDELKKFIGTYRDEISESEYEYFFHNELLLERMDERVPLICYIYDYNKLASNSGWLLSQFYINKKGTPDYVTRGVHNGAKIKAWKEDSLIQKAKMLFDDNKHTEALEAFRKAYDENPNHYYLENFIKHLEFITRSDYSPPEDIEGRYREGYEFVNDKYMGWKTDIPDSMYTLIYMEGNRYIRRYMNSMEHEILPMSETRFMVPGVYDQVLEFGTKNNTPGMNLIIEGGKEYFMERIIN